MVIFYKKPKSRDVFLLKESRAYFPLDKIKRPLICKKAGNKTSIFNAMSSKPSKRKIKVYQKDFRGRMKIKAGGSFLNIEDDYKIPNNFRKQKIGKYLGRFKNEEALKSNDISNRKIFDFNHCFIIIKKLLKKIRN